MVSNDNINYFTPEAWKRRRSVRLERIIRLRKLNAPEVIIKNEQILLYMARYKITEFENLPQLIKSKWTSWQDV